MAATTSRRRLPAPARRESILSAAISEFGHAGYDRARVADIAGRVGVTEPVVFQNFGTKAELFAAVLERASGELVRYLQSLHGRVSGADELVAILLGSGHHDRLHSHGGLGLIFTDAAEQRSETVIGQAFRHAHSRLIEGLASLLRQGQEEGSVRKDVEAVTLAEFVLSQIHARHFRQRHGKASRVLEEDQRGAVLAVLRSGRGPQAQGTGSRRIPS